MKEGVNEPKFFAEVYFSGRPFYPESIYGMLEKHLPKILPSNFFFVDLACGAGQSLFSFLKGFQNRSEESLRGCAIDSDALMLAAARNAYAHLFPAVTFIQANAESMPIPDQSVDLVLVASALHWFQRDRAFLEIGRVLKPGGFLFIYEYQFPKCTEKPELHEETKRRFNQEWKAPRQVPRGTLAELADPLAQIAGWRKRGFERPQWHESLNLEGFLGHLFSQSRYLHVESKARDASNYRDEIREFFSPYFSGKTLRFDLKPTALLFQK